MEVPDAVSQPVTSSLVKPIATVVSAGEEIFATGENHFRTEEERRRFSGICESYGIPLKDWPDFTEEKIAYNQLIAILAGEDLKLSKPGDWVLQNSDTRQVVVGRLERLIKRSEQTTKALGDSRLPTGAAVQELAQMLGVLDRILGRRLYDPLEPLMGFYGLGVPALKAVAAAQLLIPEEASDLTYLHLVGRGIMMAGQLEQSKSSVLSDLACNLIGDDGTKFCRFLGKALSDPAGKMAVMSAELVKKERMRMLPHLYWYPPNRDSVDPIIFAEPAKMLSTVQKFKLIKMAEDLRANRAALDAA